MKGYSEEVTVNILFSENKDFGSINIIRRYYPKRKFIRSLFEGTPRVPSDETYYGPMTLVELNGKIAEFIPGWNGEVVDE